MKQIHYAIPLLLVILALTLSGFQKEAPPTRAQLIEAAVRERVDDYRKKRLQRCYDKIHKTAIELVDSILIERARSMTIDTFQKPPIPARPEMPEVPIIEDTLEVAPLIEVDSLVDTSATN